MSTAKNDDFNGLQLENSYLMKGGGGGREGMGRKGELTFGVGGGSNEGELPGWGNAKIFGWWWGKTLYVAT